MRNVLLLFWLLNSIILFGQDWEVLEYNQEQDSLEFNPLKGLTPLYNVSNSFPHSIRGRIISLGEVMNGIDDFNWQIFDNFIEQQGKAGRFSYLQVNVDMGKPQSEVRLPEFLADEVSHFYYQGGTNEGDFGVSQLIVDYNDPEMMAALLNFIQRFGERYNDDPRVFLVHYGLYGVFGEWVLGFGGNFVPEGEDWEMSEENQLLITNTYESVFDKVNLLARFPENVPEPQAVGYSDGLYFGASVSDDPGFQWFFHPKLRQQNADLNWMLHPIGGEVDPDLQPTLWENFPNTVNRFESQPQNTDEIFELTRPTFLFQDFIFNQLSKVNNPNMWDNAIKATRKTGYTFYIDKYRLSAADSKPAIEVNIVNKGLAPMYAEWNVEFAYINETNEVVSLGIDSSWNLKIIQPGIDNNYRSFLSTKSLEDGNYKILFRIINPITEFADTGNAQPVRFANTSQDADKSGWLTLGELSISGGNQGEIPLKVSDFTISPDTVILGVGAEFQLSYNLSPDNATNSDITWVSDRPRTASVDKNGLVTTYNLTGDVTITGITQDGNIQRTTHILVQPFWQLPGRIEAEGYSALSDAQLGLAPAGEPGGGSVLGFINDDTWMEYDVLVSEEAEYVLDFRASSFSGDGEINILNEAGEIIGSVKLSPSTGNYDIYKTYTSDVILLPEGSYTLRLDVVSSSFNLNWVDFKLNTCPGQDPSIIGSLCDDGDENTLNDRYSEECECKGILSEFFVLIPEFIEAEDFYSSLNTQNLFTEQGEIVSLNEIGAFVAYAVSVEEDNDFILEISGRSAEAGGILELINEREDVLGSIDIPALVENPDSFSLYTFNRFALPAGNHLLRLRLIDGSADINSIEFKLGPCAGFDTGLINTQCDDADNSTQNDRFNIDCKCQGMAVDEFTLIPAIIEAEDYYDVFNVIINATPSGEEGGSVLGFIADNTWMEYAVQVEEEASFVIKTRASSFSGDGLLNILNEVGDTLGSIALMPATGNYDIYSNYVSTPFTLAAGFHRLRLDVVASAFNLNWIEFDLESSVSTFDSQWNNLLVNVYPNPTERYLNIDIENSNGKRVDIMLYDVNGALILKKEINGNSIILDLESVKRNQMLFLQVITEEKQITKRLIINDR